MNVKINPSEYKVLIVDDVISNVLLLKVLLNNEKFQIVTASNGTEALAQVKKEKPDLVLLDVMMPKIDGFGVCELIRRESNVPIIMLTVLDEEAYQIKGFDMNADDAMERFWEMEELKDDEEEF